MPRRAAPALIADLRTRIFRYPFPPGTVALAFEVFHDDFSPLPMLAYPMRDDSNQVMITGADGKASVAPYLEVLPGRDTVPKRLQKELARTGDVTIDRARLIVRWFIACWNEPGVGDRFPLRASISAHDDARGKRLATAATKSRARRS